MGVNNNNKEEKKDEGLQVRVTSSFARMNVLLKDLEQQNQELSKKEKRWKEIEDRKTVNASKIGARIHLNIGGKRFTTSKVTLMNQPCYFKFMIESNHIQRDNEGEFFIDRSPKLFGIVLDFLRTGKVNLTDLSNNDVTDLKAEFDFYLIPFPDQAPPLYHDLQQEVAASEKETEMKMRKGRSQKENEIISCANDLLSVWKDMKKTNDTLNERVKRWEEIEERMAVNAANIKNRVHLNIGGERFTTLKETLMNAHTEYFKTMFKVEKQYEDGAYFIDRNPKLFGLVLDFLRTGSVNTNDLSPSAFSDLNCDFQFFKIITGTFPGTTILSEKSHISFLAEHQLKGRRFKLLYKGSSDGFEAMKCREKINNRGPTLTIIRTSENHIIGGYASKSWTSSNAWIDDPLSFIFHLSSQRDGYNYASSPSSSHCGREEVMKKHVLHDGRDQFPQFGMDLYIVNDPKKGKSTISTRFNEFVGLKNSSFFVSEIEIFLCI